MNPRVNREILHRIIKEGESQTVDFKQVITAPYKIAKTIAAFANAAGGIIIVGVSDNRHITGIDPEEEKFLLQQAAERHCDPPIELHFTEVEEEEGVMVLVVEVFESSLKPHFTVSREGKRNIYIRVDDHNQCAG